MRWVVQQNIFRPQNLQLLVLALEAQHVPYTLVTIPRGTTSLEPDVSSDEDVYVCGAMKMKTIADAKGWKPGSFLNDNFAFDVWQQHLSDELLSGGAVVGRASAFDTAGMDRFFIRPLVDNKAFDGVVIDDEEFQSWLERPPVDGFADMDVVIAPARAIYREYRLFYVDKTYVTGSLYKVAGHPQASPEVEPDVVDYADSVRDRWTPADSFVVDVCLSDDGYKVVEFNNINSSGFYACDVGKYVAAIQRAYG
mgnify:CR=1 FL=1